MIGKINKLVAFILFMFLIIGCGKSGNHSGQNGICDTTFVDSLEIKVQDSLFTNVAYSRSLIREAMKQSCDSFIYYRLRSLYAKTFFITSDFDSILHYNRAVKRYCGQQPLSVPIHSLLSVVYNIEGNIDVQQAQPDSAIADYLLAYRHRRMGQKLIYLPDICINLADANVHKGDYANAAFYYRRALFLCDSLQLPDRNKFPVYYGLGQTYTELRDFDLSNHYYEMAGHFFSQMNVSEKWLYLNNRGSNYYYQKDYAKAIHYIGKALNVVHAHPQMVFERNLCKGNLGELFVLTGKLDSAKIYLNDSFRYFSSIGNQSAVYYVETQMIELALKEGNIALAGQMIRRTLPDRHVDASIINIRNQYLQHYFERTGNYKMAYDYLKRDLYLNDSVRNERVRTRVAELDMRYRQDTIVMRREILIQKQSGEMKVLRLTMYVWILACGVLVVASVIIYWYMKKKRRFIQERHLNQISRFRMENIRNRLSPHFTFNVLNREISQFKDQGEMHNDLGELVTLLRKSLELTEKLSIPLNEELDFVRTYIHLEKSRVGDDFFMTISVDKDLDTQQFIIPSMIVQIPVENALKHGLVGVQGEKHLDIRVIREGNGVKIEIRDNGRGYSPHTMSSTRGTGTGLKVLYQTIQLLNAKNKEKIRFEISNITEEGKTGTLVSVYIPYNYIYDL